MADHTAIEWTDATWNPITGCSVVSPGCTNCYAMRLAGTRLKHHPSRAGLTLDSKAGPVWNGEVRLNEGWLSEPLRWARPRLIFVCAHGDLFHESVPDAWIDRVFAVMALCPQHTFQVLTKRSARMRGYASDPGTPGRIARELVDEALIEKRWPFRSETWPVQSIGDIDLPDDVTVMWPLTNVWLGVSAEDQRRADERVPDLLSTPAAVRFVSAEPLIRPIDFGRIFVTNATGGAGRYDALAGEWRPGDLAEMTEGGGPRLSWIIAGGESGPGARAMHPAWVRQIRDQCAAAGVAFHFKQWGTYAPGGPAVIFGDVTVWRDTPSDAGPSCEMLRVGKKAAGRLLDGVEHNGMPAIAGVPMSDGRGA